MTQDTNNIPDLQSPFEQLREIDADGKEWWNSRKLAGDGLRDIGGTVLQNAF